ncbi:MAG: xanthine dehydrogenase family protein molybdopterin-binding subunit [Chloroflexota bacterium]
MTLGSGPDTWGSYETRTESEPVVIGTPRPRPDSGVRVTGALRYALDEPPIAGMLHARLVLGVYAHARIDAIDASAALAIPGVVAVLTADDLPITGTTDMRMFVPLARGEAVFAGQPVAMVLAETEAAAADAVDAVIVEATPLPAALDVEASMAPNAPVARPRAAAEDGEGIRNIHSSVGGSDDTSLDALVLSPNVIGRTHHHQGDVELALATSDAVVSRRFETPWVYQAYLETHAAIAIPTPEGGLDVAASTQGTAYTRTQLSKIYGIPMSRIRVRGTPIGGGFGSKVMLAEPLAAGAALAVKRPVRLSLTRSEDLLATNPAPAGIIEVEAGATRDGTLTGLRGRVVFDSGAYSEWTIESIAAVLLTGPYRWQALDVRAFGVETNRFGTGSYRGPGGPQASFAIEQVIDELARDLGIDPVDLRRRNLATQADKMADGADWPPVGTTAVLDAIEADPAWAERGSLPAGEGIGIGLGLWAGACAPASVTAKLETDGTLTIATGMVDMSGTTATFQALAAEAFGIKPDDVTIVVADTGSLLRSPITGGSVVTYSVGRSVVMAATEAKERLLRYAADQLEIAPGDLEIVDGVVRPKGAPDRGLTVAELADKGDGLGVNGEPIEGHGATDKPALAPGISGHLVHVRVDPDSGQVEVLRYKLIQDAGRAVNPALVEGQMRGGAVQALGWALFEELQFGDEGQLLTGSFLDYAVPKASQVPPIETVIVEVPAPDGPYGARGVGEAPVCGGAAAVANAISAAAGVRLERLPMTPPRVRAAIEQARDRS